MPDRFYRQKPSVPGGHKLNLPWRIKEGATRDIVDCNGVPGCFASSTTSLRGSARHDASDGSFVVAEDYNTTETVGPIRAELIVAAVNAYYHGVE